jgi:hypothetical protein
VGASIRGHILGPVKDERAGDEVLIPRARESVGANVLGELSRGILIGFGLCGEGLVEAIGACDTETTEENKGQHGEETEVGVTPGWGRRQSCCVHGRSDSWRFDLAGRFTEAAHNVEEKKGSEEKETCADDVIAHLRTALEPREAKRDEVVEDEDAKAGEVEEIAEEHSSGDY